MYTILKPVILCPVIATKNSVIATIHIQIEAKKVLNHCPNLSNVEVSACFSTPGICQEKLNYTT